MNIPSFTALPEETRTEITDAIKSLLRAGRDTRYIADLLSKPQSFGHKLTRTELLTLSNEVCREVNEEIKAKARVESAQLKEALLASPTFRSLMQSSGARFRF
jgi:hypothetical protein